MRIPIEKLQGLGRALMLPIAVLPVAALMLRIGQADVLNIPYIAAAGDAIFANLGLIFAVGVAVGFARENHGAAALAGVVCYFVASKGAEALIEIPAASLQAFTDAAHDLALAAAKAKTVGKFSVPLGILSGLIAGAFYNRFATIRLPDYLAFFGGRRFVPIVSGVAGLGLALAFGLSWSWLAQGMDAASLSIVESGNIGLFIYGVLNRLLIVTGLHHILNNVVWFIVGDFHGATGDLKRFFAGDPTAGAYMSGFFPVMMFGLPAACFAMYRSALPGRRKGIAGMLLSLALTSALTGVTEPVEFTFMFLAPVLFAVHAILTGIAMVIMNALNVKLGFGFSAGLFDYVLNFNKASNPWLLLPIGLAYSGAYYGLFRFFILRFKLKTPGREDESVAVSTATNSDDKADRALSFIAALGGANNIQTIDACTTRLRLIVADQNSINDRALQALGAMGIVRPSERALQVVLGPIADQVAGEIRAALPASRVVAPTPSPIVADASVASAAPTTIDVAALVTALGGAQNIQSAEARSSRVCVRLVAAQTINVDAIKQAGIRAVAVIDAHTVHLVRGAGTELLAKSLQAIVR